ncbi:MAG: hypothetical protein ACFE7R_05145, partial [Candidatus Hodarchaeota archaeon]
MTEESAKAFYKAKVYKAQRLSVGQVILGLLGSTVIMIGSTWGLILVYDFLRPDWVISPNNLGLYTIAMLLGSIA